MVAEATGVSVASAPRVLAGHGDLSRQTRERVLDAAQTLGSERRSSLRGRPVKTDERLIELVLRSFDDAWTAPLLGDEARRLPTRLDLVLTLERDDPADDWPARWLRGNLGRHYGIIPTKRIVGLRRAARLPHSIVLLDFFRSDPDGNWPASVRRLAGWATTPVPISSTRAPSNSWCQRRPGLSIWTRPQEGISSGPCGLAPDRPIPPHIEPVDGCIRDPEMLRVLREAAHPIGVFCGNDEMAYDGLQSYSLD